MIYLSAIASELCATGGGVNLYRVYVVAVVLLGYRFSSFFSFRILFSRLMQLLQMSDFSLIFWIHDNIYMNCMINGFHLICRWTDLITTSQSSHHFNECMPRYLMEKTPTGDLYTYLSSCSYVQKIDSGGPQPQEKAGLSVRKLFLPPGGCKNCYCKYILRSTGTIPTRHSFKHT